MTNPAILLLTYYVLLFLTFFSFDNYLLKHYLLIEKLQNDNKQSLEKEQEIEKDYINLKEEIEERQKKILQFYY